jgi:hypothetical protein
MPTLPNVPGGVKVVCEGTVGSAPYANIFHFILDTTTGITNAQAVQIATGVHTAMKNNLMTYLPSNVNLLQTVAQGLSSASDGVGAFAQTQPGGGGTTIGPANNCLLVKHIIARRYRGGHPRTYLPGLTVNYMADPQHWTAAQVTNLQGAWNAFITACVATVITGNVIDNHVNVSYYGDRHPQTVPPTPRPTPLIDIIQQSTVEATIATQRRRVGR